MVLFYSDIALGYFFNLPAVLGFFIGISADTVTPCDSYTTILIALYLVLHCLGADFSSAIAHDDHDVFWTSKY